jgi:LytS/YehU family sensor histidine kinase
MKEFEDPFATGLVVALIAGLSVGLTGGPIVGLAFGLDAALQRGIFRLPLWAQHIAPFRYVPPS